jgi:hypothetical protein
MTRKRFKLSLAALCLLTAFFMALIGLLLAPTLASAEKNSGADHPHADEPNGNGAPNPVYSEHANWHEQDKDKDKITWNAPHTDPCADQPCGNQHDDTQYSEGGSSGDGDHFSNGRSGNDEHNGNEGNGSSGSHNGGGSGGGFGGFPGGSPGGSPELFAPDSSNHGDTCSDKSDKSSGDSDKSCSDDSDPDDSGHGDKGPQVDLTPPNDPYSDPSHDPRHDPDGLAGSSPEDKNTPEGPTTNLVTEVPEPLTLSLFVAGLAGSMAMRRRQKAK